MAICLSTASCSIPPSQVHTTSLEPGEVCVINIDEDDAQKVDQIAVTQGYTKKKRRILTSLGFVMSIFQVSSEQSVQAAIQTLRKHFPSLIIDANHHYYLQSPHNPSIPRLYAHQLIGWTQQAQNCVDPNIRIGMIDTPVNVHFLHTKQRMIHTKSFVSPDRPKSNDFHGTAVATLLVGPAHSSNDALIPHGTLFVAEAFQEKQSDHMKATTWTIVRALDWLAEQQVHVINLSLGGPPNALLSFAIKNVLEQGIPIVAAGGNAGPNGRPIFPAAQPGVIAVTAVDVNLEPYQHANQGDYIAFSAPGVDIWIPQQQHKSGQYKSGTSFATPFVTAVTALVKQTNPRFTPGQIIHQLATQALDLGQVGKDRVYGWGLIQVPQLCPS